MYSQPTPYSGLGPTPNQKNSWATIPTSIIGSILGGIFSEGNPLAIQAGGMIGKQVGYPIGNMWAGRDAYNGKTGDFWDNFNPMSKAGFMSLPQMQTTFLGPNSPMGMLGGMGGGLPGLGGGLPGLGGGLPGLGGGLPLSGMFGGGGNPLSGLLGGGGRGY